MTQRKGNSKTAANGDLLYSFDAGNGKAKGISSASPELCEFEPILAPMTDKRALNESEARPSISLLRDGQVMVFGLDNVEAHGKRSFARRLNASERYTSADYFHILDALYLQTFAHYRGQSEHIAPMGVISLPIQQYNDNDVLSEVRSTLIGKRTLEDYEGCTLRLDIQDKRLLIIPESAGAMTHYAFDAQKLTKRGGDNPTAGVTAVFDVGYETTDISFFSGMAYQRDASFSISPDAGMGIVARTIESSVNKKLRGVTASQIDRAMRRIAGTKPGATKQIEAAPGVFVEVGQAYDDSLALLAERIRDEVLTNYGGTVTRVLLAGGGAYHLKNHLTNMLPETFGKVYVAPDPDTANVWGGYTMLRLKQQREKA